MDRRIVRIDAKTRNDFNKVSELILSSDPEISKLGFDLFKKFELYQELSIPDKYFLDRYDMYYTDSYTSWVTSNVSQILNYMNNCFNITGYLGNYSKSLFMTLINQIQRSQYLIEETSCNYD